MNGLPKTLSNICVKFYFPNQGIKMLKNISQCMVRITSL